VAAALMHDSQTLASGGMPPRRLVTEGPHCASAKVERSARIPFIEGPEQAYTTCVRRASFLFHYQRDRRKIYSKSDGQRAMHPCLSPASRLSSFGSNLGLGCE
jgi:hypothetical protein